VANHKRKHPHWSRLCMCKYYKQAGNGKNRRKPRELVGRERLIKC
jgi:hypothetical protein